MRLLHTLPPLLVALAALGCSPGAGGPDDTGTSGDTNDTGDTDIEDTDSGDTDSGDTDSGELPDELNGAPPDEPIALPTFTARNMDGATRTEADLVGHPTVIWFYPAAGTYG